MNRVLLTNVRNVVAVGALGVLIGATSASSVTSVTASPDEPPMVAPAPEAANPSPDASRAVEIVGRTGAAAGAAPARPHAEDHPDESVVGSVDIPEVALAAYQVAAATMSTTSPECGLGWPLVAAVGRVESDHGRFAGATLDDDGVSAPLIRGVALDGRGPVARIDDTDGGSLDGDGVWDRAVGPMQFLPATWRSVGVDADGDGVRSPDDIDDAALAAAVYLCAQPQALTTADGMRRAALRYNPSEAYADVVLEWEAAYRTGSTDGGDPPTAWAGDPVEEVTKPWPGPDPTPTGPLPTGTPDEPTTGPRPSTSPSPHGSPSSGPPKPTPSGSPSGSPSGNPSGNPTPRPTPAPTPSPTPSPTPKPTPSPTPDPTPDPTPSPTPDPTPTPSPTPGECPVDVPAADGAGQDDPGAAAETVTLGGTLLECEGRWYLAEPDRITAGNGAGPSTGPDAEPLLLDVGDATVLARDASADHDGDGAVESNADELAGLAGTEVRLVVVEGTDPAYVVRIGEAAYRSLPG